VGNEDGTLQVRLDMWHAMNRVVRRCKQSHGAFNAFAASLRDAFFLVNKDDLEAFRVRLTQQQKWSEDRIRELMDNEWAWVIKQCRRRVPEASLLLARFNRVVSEYGHLPDAKTGQLLLSKEAWREVKNLRKHIQVSSVTIHT
ncbi:unnamed protein product, partial [Chrysoparadoxa australica]